MFLARKPDPKRSGKRPGDFDADATRLAGLAAPVEERWKEREPQYTSARDGRGAWFVAGGQNAGDTRAPLVKPRQRSPGDDRCEYPAQVANWRGGLSVVRGWVVGLVVIAALAGLCACASDPYVTTSRPIAAGHWRIEHGVIDRTTGVPVSAADLFTRQSETQADYLTKPAMLSLLCFKQRPTVRIKFMFKAGSTLNASLGYRFDDKPGHEAAVRFLRDQETLVIEDRAEVARFASQLATSRVLYIRIRALNFPRSSAEFNVEGGDVAVRHAFASCPIGPALPQAATLQ